MVHTPAAIRCRVALRAATVAVLTWMLCRWLLGQHHPYPAAVAALLTIQPTAYRSCTAGVQYAAGSALGVLIAVPVVLTVPSAWAGLAIVTLASSLAGGASWLGHRGIHVPATAVMVFLIGRKHLDADFTSHLTAVGIGVAVGVVFNLLVFPPVHVKTAEAAVERLRAELARILRAAASTAADGTWPPEALGDDWRAALAQAVSAAQASVDAAHESLRLNLRRLLLRRHPSEPADRQILATLQQVADDTGVLIKLLDSINPRPTSSSAVADRAPSPEFRHRFARLLESAAVCIAGSSNGLPHPHLTATHRSWERLVHTLERRRRGLSPRSPEGRLLMLLERILNGLAGETVWQEPHPGAQPADTTAASNQATWGADRHLLRGAGFRSHSGIVSADHDAEWAGAAPHSSGGRR
ncbi:FUSC family protein [Streptomyces boninensis]|uniref:FUSC family protein n=1 Tax=Streptomyces boninensis TaxID=2039455 RepID=UPI003B220C85